MNDRQEHAGGRYAKPCASEAADCTRLSALDRRDANRLRTGPAPAPLMLVGEQPGDKEDLAGLLFVGPAGQVLDRGLEEAGIDRNAVYVTNAVKHFKFLQRGKFRLHQKPVTPEIRACRPWFDANWSRSSPIWWWRWGRPPRNPSSEDHANRQKPAAG